MQSLVSGLIFFIFNEIDRQITMPVTAASIFNVNINIILYYRSSWTEIVKNLILLVVIMQYFISVLIFFKIHHD